MVHQAWIHSDLERGRAYQRNSIVVVDNDDDGDDNDGDNDDDGDDGDDDGGGNALLVLPVVQLESLAACRVLEVKW